MRSRFFSFAHVLIGKPVPTFPGHALLLRMSLSENRFPLFRDMRCFCACPYRKTGSHFSGTCAASAHVLIGKPVPTFPGHALMHAFSTEMIRMGACADGNTGNRDITAPRLQYLPRGRELRPTPPRLARGVFRPDAGREERGEA